MKLSKDLHIKYGMEMGYYASGMRLLTFSEHSLDPKEILNAIARSNSFPIRA